jgi:Domain of unknown function (DUF5666)
MRRLLMMMILAVPAISAACGGKGSSPTTPSEATPATGSASSATITGTVQGASAVQVEGTALNATVDGAGRFALANVPAGDVQLQFSGGGASATVPLGPVQASQRIDLVVTVSGATASVESKVTSGGADAELEGRVESLPPTTAALTFKAAGRLVKTGSSTRFQDGSASRSFADLQIGMRVHVKGSLAGDAINATLVELQNSQVDLPVEVNGVVDSLSGSSSGFQFKIGSTQLKGDATTVFFGDGDTSDSFADLKNGSRVEVKGQQRDGFVFAARIHINGTTDDPNNPPQDTSASIEGVLKAMSGAAPTFVLTVDATTVRTSSSTTVKRRGDFQTLDTLRVGQTLHVVGTRKSDGSIDARLIEIDDDAVGGEVEIEGSVGGLQGTCPAVSFGINGFSITTNASTTFDGQACTAIKNGDKVKVNGTKQSNGSVLATRVKKS